MKHLGLFIFLIYFIGFMQSSFGQFNYVWANTFGNAGEDRVNDFYVDSVGNIYSTGFYYDSIDIDAGPDSLILVAEAYSDIFIQKTDSLGNLIWGVTLGGNGYDNGNGITADNEGNVYCVGSFSYTADFDPGPDEYLKTSFGGILSSDIFILKIDMNGNFLWVKTMGNSAVTFGCSATRVARDSAGNIYFSALFAGTIDVNPGPVTNNFTSIDAQDILLEKLDSDGNYIWASQFGGSNQQFSRELIVQENSVFLGGSFYYTVDFDPGPPTHNLTSAGYFDTFFLELTLDGTFVNVGKIGNAENDVYGGIAVDQDGNKYYTGAYQGSVDIDMTVAEFNVTSAGYYDLYVIKTDPGNNLIWAITHGDENSQTSKGICVDSAKNIYLAGGFTDTFDADPGPGVTYLTSLGSTDWFFEKLNSDGNFIFANSIGGPSTEYSLEFGVDNSEYFYVAGEFESTFDFDPGDSVLNITAYGDKDAFILKMRQSACSTFGLMIDSVADQTCAIDGYGAGHAFGGISPYNYVWNTIPAINDSIVFIDTIGIYTLTAEDADGCNRSSSVLVNGPVTTTGFDLQANLITGYFTPGVHGNIWLDALNEGCFPVSGSLILEIDTLLIIDSVDSEPDFIYGDSLIWNFTDLIYDGFHITQHLYFHTSEEASDSDEINLNLSITPAIWDIDTTNNYRNYTFPVLIPVDPNIKFVYPDGDCDAGYILPDQTLTYTITFQNTGTAEAVNIDVLDTLSEWLDINSLAVVGKSHAMFTEILPGNVLKFNYNNIHLPDSTTNEAESHGYVIFEIRPLPATPTGSVIENRSAIYFDYNDPVFTNSVLNTVIDVIPDFDITQMVEICEGESFTVGFNTYSTSGTYVDHFNSYLGCDSSVTTILLVNPIYNVEMFPEICDGESYPVGVHIYTTTGIYYDSLFTFHGCDSIILTHLDVHPLYTDTIEADICAGEAFVFHEIEYFDTGFYTAYLNSMFGCDSIINLSLTVNEIDVSTYTLDTSLIAQASGAAYQWVDCLDGYLAIEGATDQSFTPEYASEFAVIINQNGCVDTSACFAVGPADFINNFSEITVMLYPNPASQSIMIKTSIPIYDATLEIKNLFGETVFIKTKFNPATEMFDISGLAPGFYLLHLHNIRIDKTVTVIKD
ncbi:MAG: SBBP repeat-containing protein [Chitinophagales bacterium]